jgi:hypothetical protein
MNQRGMKRQEGGENCIKRNCVVFFAKYNEDIKLRRMRWAGHVT